MIVVTLHVDAALAVRAGHGRAGPAKLQIGEQELARLTERQRDTLARHIAGEDGWARPLNRGAPAIGTADLETLARLLDLRYLERCAHHSARVWIDERECEPGSGVLPDGEWTSEAWRIDGAPGTWDDYHAAVCAAVRREQERKDER